MDRLDELVPLRDQKFKYVVSLFNLKVVFDRNTLELVFIEWEYAQDLVFGAFDIKVHVSDFGRHIVLDENTLERPRLEHVFPDGSILEQVIFVHTEFGRNAATPGFLDRIRKFNLLVVARVHNSFHDGRVPVVKIFREGVYANTLPSILFEQKTIAQKCPILTPYVEVKTRLRDDRQNPFIGTELAHLKL